MSYMKRGLSILLTAAMLATSPMPVLAKENTKTCANTSKTCTNTSNTSSNKTQTMTYTKVRFAKRRIAIRKLPKAGSKKLMSVKRNKKMKAGKVINRKWIAVKINNKIEGYAKVKYISSKKTGVYKWKGKKLTKRNGTVHGPSGKETYYNLPMRGVLRIMKKYGYTKKDYKVRKDGVKTLDGYVMVACNLHKHKRGSLIKTTRGMGIVCDECPAGWLDIAVNW